MIVPLLASAVSHAQLPFSEAIRLTQQNSPRIAAAKNDELKARGNLAATRDIFIPSVAVSGGVGTAYGPTLNIPSIFSVSAQSLIFSEQQLSPMLCSFQPACHSTRY